MSQYKKENHTNSSDNSLKYREIIHDVKNKLHFILNNHEYMEEELTQCNSGISGEFKEIIKENRQGLQAAMDLLVNSLVSSRSIEDFSVLNPKIVLEDTIKSFGSQFSGIHLKKHIGSFYGRLIGPQERLNLIFSNLIGNSIQCFPKDFAGERIISLVLSQEEHKSLSFEIEDNGPGIEPENLKKIFESGFTTKETSRGTGMGLGIVKNLIENDFSGKINVRSEPGKGTVFVVEFPLRDKGS